VSQVDFYILHGMTSALRLRFICRLSEKIWRQGQRLYIHAESETQARQLDNLLWTFRLDSFVPHELWLPDQVLSSPIQIGYDVRRHPSIPLLLNTTLHFPVFIEECERVLEPIEDTPVARELARERYRRYRTLNWDIRTHDISNVP
jgi:DNA polymerase III subunit chi